MSLSRRRGKLVLLTMSADPRQARLTSVVDDIRVWVDGADSNPGQDLWNILEEEERRGRRLGIELEAWCLTGKRWDNVRTAIEGRCEYEDSSELVSRLRLIKSDAELEYVRKAAALADDALAAAQRLAKAGTPEQDVRGKAVLIRGTTRPTGFGDAATLAMERGAAGIITDYLLYQTPPFRTRESLPEPVQLLRMPTNLPSAWAISVNYPAAEHLASLARRGAANIWADIQARTFKGESQNLLADISGTDEAGQIIQFVAHSPEQV